MTHRNAIAIFALSAVLGGTALAAGRWDGSFEPKGTLTAPTTGTNNLQVPAGSYVKVQCDVAAYLGQGQGAATACTATTCDRVAAGERWYAQLMPHEDRVAALGVSATATCTVWRSRN